MKFHQHLVDQYIEALEEIFENQRYADKTIQYYFKNNKQWGKRDRSFFAESIYESVRWWRRILFVCEMKPTQVDYEIFGYTYLLMKHEELPHWIDGEISESHVAKKLIELEKAPRDIRESMPHWLDKLAESELGESWTECLSSLNEPAPVILRVNTKKYSLIDLKKHLEKEGIFTSLVDGVDTALMLKERKNVFATELFQKGAFEVQDGASQLVAPYADLADAQRVIDACAGAGGKSLHISNLMSSKGRVISLDIYQWKLNELKKRAKRAGANNIETRAISSSKVVKRLQESADVVYLDVPCSGLGVLRRNPDTKWKLSQERMKELRELQQDILSRYSKMVKKGGQLVYSTCSILPSENQEQVEKFLKSHSEFTFCKEQKILPSSGLDGFYMCLLKRQP